MKRYEVQFIHTLEQEITCVVEADSEEQAIEKAKKGEWIDSDEEFAPMEGVNTDFYECLGEVDG